MVTITEIQKYLEKNHQAEIEDKIKDKSKERVLRSQAEAIKNNKPLKQGQCNLCSRPDERLVPVTMRCCLTCVNKFMKRGGGIEVVQKISGDYLCDYCFARSFSTLYINPRVCKYCSSKIGNRHKTRRDDKADNQKKMDKQKEKFMKKEIGGK